MKRYPTDLNDQQWAFVRRTLPACVRNRRRSCSLRRICNAILCVLRSGCQWRLLPHGYPDWHLVYYYFRRWEALGIVCQANGFTVHEVHGEPEVVYVDAQSIKTNAFNPVRGYDGYKKILGRKRHIVINERGALLGCKVTVANTYDGKWVTDLIQDAEQVIKMPRVIIGDGAIQRAPEAR